ncbi:MAG TPA: DUF3617 family protein [Edaphobacter sp.]|jgi:hypothetical protein|nr:DUF3617 family protein [Edaphobacter sp.]
MLLKLILSAPLLLLAGVPQTQNGNSKPMDTAPGQVKLPSTPPVKMGLWESTATNGRGVNYKTRSCFTKESYQTEMAKMPPGCTISNQAWTGHSFTADVGCTMRDATSTGHVDVQFPDTETIHSAINISVTAQGQTMPITFTTDSHFISADCGDIPGGESRPVR